MENQNQKIRILVADDEKEIRDVLTMLLTAEDFEVIAAADGREAVELAEASIDLYILDEPIGGVDPAARDYILRTILTNYDENASILISTHLISDIENVLDRVIFLKSGQLALNASVDEIRTQYGKSVDVLFREVFKC